jgi:hypothetical protein
MVTLRRLSQQFALLLFLGIALPAGAEQVEEFDDYRIHYNAFVSNLLSPEVARAHDLKRSRYHAVVNITVQKKKNGIYESVTADVSGTATNLYGKQQKLGMKQVTERDAVYYLGQMPFSNEETLTFDILVIPEGEKVARNISFRQQFFVD